MASGGFLHKPAAEQVSQFRRMRSIGITSVRFDANWNYAEHAGPGVFAWTQLDREVHSALAGGLSVDLVIDGCPPWAARPGSNSYSAPRPASAAQFALWAQDVAARYAPFGVHTYEIWNEPNDSKYWQPATEPAFYTKMLIAAYIAIKRADKSAFVISGGLAPVATGRGSYNALTFLKDMYADGAKGHFDAVGDHPYSFPALPQSYEAWSGWAQMYETVPSLRSIMSSHGDGSKEIWITEFGAPSRGPRGIGNRGEAAELTEGIRLAKRTSWVGAFYIYVWQDLGTNLSSNADWFGLLTAQGRRKPAYDAVASAIRGQ
jgi:hypothetical protein